MPAVITDIRELSPTACEVHLRLPEPLYFLPGAFVNTFLTVDGKKMRRAYSISSSPSNQEEISLSIRKGSPDGMSALFFDESVKSLPLEIMGPLGRNTIDHIQHPKVFLFGFGIGASVVKGMLHGLLDDSRVQSVMVVTGSRTEEEILYKDFFESVVEQDSRVQTRFVVSRPQDSDYPYSGYIQSHIADFDFKDASVYICGTGNMCEELRIQIENLTENPPQFLIEAFD